MFDLGANLKLIGVSGLAFFLAMLTTCQAGKLVNRGKTITEANKTITKVTGERDACLSNLGTLNAAVDRQNEAVEAYRADSERRLSEATAAVRQAQAAAVGAKKRAAAILVNRPAAPSCATAEAVLRGREG